MQKHAKPCCFCWYYHFYFSTGCTVVDATEVTADLRPDKYWKGSGVLKRSAQIEFSGDKVLIEADSVIQYLGENPPRMQIVIRAPYLRAGR